MRISDWSSDVCSSDLQVIAHDFGAGLVVDRTDECVRDLAEALAALFAFVDRDGDRDLVDFGGDLRENDLDLFVVAIAFPGAVVALVDHGAADILDRKSVVWGKSVSVRVDLVGRRLLNTKNKKLP